MCEPQHVSLQGSHTHAAVAKKRLSWRPSRGITAGSESLS
jgi:hypothetical protein